MPVDLIQNMAGSGEAIDRLLANDFDVGVLRPWLGRDGRSYVTRMVRNHRTGANEPKVFTTNAPATLTKDAWLLFDNAIIRAVRERLRAFADIRQAGLTYTLPNGMAHTILQYQTMGDITAATISMDPIRRGENDRPEFNIASLPLPIVHKDFDFSAREIMVSRQTGVPLDTTVAEMAGRKVAEEIEKMTVGTAGTYSYGGGTIYGYTNFPQRTTKTDMPVPDGTNGPAVITALLTLRQMLITSKHFGPYVLYLNSQWAAFLDNDFSGTKGDQTLRQRILSIDGITDVRILDHLPVTQYHAILVEMTSETVRAVVGMEVQTLQWESLGGMMKHFKVMALQVPQLRADTAGTSGIAHGRTA
jgi:hypothetical protein